MRFLLAAAALLSATPAFATDWTVVGYSDDTYVLADRDSVERPGQNRVIIRLLYVLREDRGVMSAVEARTEYDCPNNRYRRLHIKGLDAQGAVKVEQDPGPEWKDFQPGDLGSGIFGRVCVSGAIKGDAVSGSIPQLIVKGRQKLAEG